IEAAAEVGKAATSIFDIEDLLDNVVKLISERFGFYQAGIFFIDDNNEFAVLQAASSDGGKRMLARQHKLQVGAEGMVGYVTSQGQARIALDVGEDAVFFNTPELPQTRSEMTLPLFYGGRIFGALDVQSTESNAFVEEDISALTVLADQVSMAINNARLISDLQSSLETERQAFGEVSRNAWQRLIRRSGVVGYKFQNNRVSPVEKIWPEEMAEALQKQQIVNTFDQNGALSVPIMVSGRAVGAIRVRKSSDLVTWSEDEIELIEVLTDRLSQALESARVYQTSQRQALQEQLTGEISSQLRQTLDIDTVLKTAARELGDAFNAKEVVIRMAPN
ncbi:MAG: GAF domain-containing protein, partial [Thermoleophilia bacterium]|nr:GAF domain-containing protein [Thermoleophilia bacterium]